LQTKSNLVKRKIVVRETRDDLKTDKKLETEKSKILQRKKVYGNLVQNPLISAIIMAMAIKKPYKACA